MYEVQVASWGRLAPDFHLTIGPPTPLPEKNVQTLGPFSVVQPTSRWNQFLHVKRWRGQDRRLQSTEDFSSSFGFVFYITATSYSGSQFLAM